MSWKNKILFRAVKFAFWDINFPLKGMVWGYKKLTGSSEDERKTTTTATKESIDRKPTVDEFDAGSDTGEKADKEVEKEF